MWYRETVDGRLIKMDTMEWVTWKEQNPEQFNAAHVVGRDVVNGLTVSTVCLFLDHRFGPGEPLIYETMIFDHSDPGHEWSELYCDRYPTRAVAMLGHEAAIERVKSGEVKPRLRGAEEEGAG